MEDADEQDEDEDEVLAQKAMNAAAACNFLRGAAMDGQRTAFVAASLVRAATTHGEHHLDGRVRVALGDLQVAVRKATGYELDDASIVQGQCDVERLLSGRMRMESAVISLVGLGMLLRVPKEVRNVMSFMLECAFTRVRLLVLPDVKLVSAVAAATAMHYRGKGSRQLRARLSVLSSLEHQDPDVREIMAAVEQVCTDPLADVIRLEHKDTVLHMILREPSLVRRASPGVLTGERQK
jgi:hypothetical protein